MKVCVIGGGNIGTALVCHIKKTRGDARVSLLTRRPEAFSEAIRCNETERGVSYSIRPDCISSDPREAASGADIVFIALPHFAVEDAFGSISPFVSENAFIGVIPGYGGCEFFFEKYFGRSRSLFGFQRVPFITRLEEYGREVNILSWKPFSVVSAQYPARTDAACELIESCGLKTQKAANFLSVALTPTNPILHTSRIYELFGKYPRDHVYASREKLYVGWSDLASETLFAMDRELHELLDSIPELDTSAIRPLSEHYESQTVPELNRKINGIPSFQGIYAPMVGLPDGSGYTVDTDSRLFTEDFPFGLAIIKADCELCGISTPTMDRVLKWYADFTGKNWFVNGEFRGSDLALTGIPQRYGVTAREALLSYYL